MTALAFPWLLAFLLAPSPAPARTAPPASGQALRHEARALNVEIPVRVFKGTAFVDSLALDDFEVLEDGVAQRLDAVYLILGSEVHRKEERDRSFQPATGRRLFLVFEMTDYDPRLFEALDLFARNVLAPGDTLTVGTPAKTYRLRPEVLASAGPERLRDQLLGLVRHDILLGNAEYRNAFEDLTGMAKTLGAAVSERLGRGLREGIGGLGGADVAGNETEGDEKASVEEILSRYVVLLQNLENQRGAESRRFLELASHLRGLEGQKTVFVFYQREFLPTLEPRLLNAALSAFQDTPYIGQTISDVFMLQTRQAPMDVGPVKRAFADSAAAVHFLFLKAPAPQVPGLVMEENSNDIFAPFREMAVATGGFSEASGNLAFLMRSAAQAMANYYLLYYTPRNRAADGSFRNLTVRVKGGGVRVVHRAGYVAD